MLTKSLASLALLALGVSAFPVVQHRSPAGFVKLPITRHSNKRETGLTERSFTSSLANQGIYYTIDITLGTPPQPLTLVLDTGSSDIWGYSPSSVDSCSNCTQVYYDETQSSTAVQLPELGVFNISYGSPNSGVLGYYAADILTIGDTSVNQTVGVATVAHEGDPPNGIFGVGLSLGESIVDFGREAYPGYIDTLYAAGIITARAYSIFLDDKTFGDTTPGTIIFGGYDSSKWTGDLVTFPIVTPAPDGEYRLDVAEPAIAIEANGESVSVPASSDLYTVLLDTGTAITRLPSDQFAFIAEAVGAQIIGNGPGYAVSCSLADASGGVDFTFTGSNGGVTVTVPWIELVIPDSSELPEGVCEFGLLPQDADVAQGVYILGETVLRSLYLIFDFDSLEIGIAQANYDGGESKVKAYKPKGMH